MSAKQDVITRQPKAWVKTTNTLSKSTGIVTSSDEVRGALAAISLRTTTGASRPKPAVLTPTAYSANYQRSGGLHRFQYELQDNAFWRIWEQGGGGALSSLAGGFDLTVPDFDWADVEDKALDDLNEKVRGGLDVSVDAAQYKSVVKMLNVGEQLLDYTKLFGRKGSALAALVQGSSNARLQYVYGVQPFVKTLYGAADEASRIVINKIERFEGKGSLAVQATHMRLNTPVGYVNFPLRSANCRAYVKYGVSCYVPEWDLSRWSSMNPASIAWELMPYSFVVDWVVNVGGYLRNLETALLQASRFRHGYKTRMFRGNCVGFWHDGNWEVWGVTLDMNRTVLSSYPMPSLPRFKVELGSTRLLNAAALIGAALTRKP